MTNPFQKVNEIFKNTNTNINTNNNQGSSFNAFKFNNDNNQSNTDMSSSFQKFNFNINNNSNQQASHQTAPMNMVLNNNNKPSEPLNNKEFILEIRNKYNLLEF